MADDIFGGEPEEQLPVDEPQEDVPAAAEAEPPAEAEAEAPAEASVPIAALHEAREQQRTMRAEMDQMRQQMQQQDDLRTQLDEYRKSQQQEDKFETDPLGAIRDEVLEVKQSTEQQQQAIYAAQQRAELEQRVASQAQAFTETTPDYPDALNHVMSMRAQELKLWGAPESEIPMMLEQEALQIGQQAMQMNMNPAELVYRMAEVRGYTKATKQPEPALETIEKGQQASQSLTDAPGRSGDVGLQDIAKMSDEEFDKLWGDMDRDARGGS